MQEGKTHGAVLLRRAKDAHGAGSPPIYREGALGTRG